MVTTVTVTAKACPFQGERAKITGRKNQENREKEPRKQGERTKETGRKNQGNREKEPRKQGEKRLLMTVCLYAKWNHNSG